MRNLDNDELNDLYFSANIFRVTKSKRMKWTWHVARIGDRRDAYRVLVKERDYLEDPDVDGRILLRWIFRKCDGGVEWIDLA